jgi:protein arginine kinase
VSSLAYVISSRIRVARNLRDYPFPHKATAQERQEALERICQALRRKPCCRDSRFLWLDRLDALERKLLEEERLISHLSATSGSARAVLLSKKRGSSVLINEEDHLRIQAFAPGLALGACRRAAHRLERCLQNALPFAYSEAEGYLTSCPQNAGSGIRVSAMLFLPGLTLLGRLTQLLHHCVQAGYTIRGAYGEGSRAEGCLVQLSLNVPRKQTLETSMEQYGRCCRQLIHHERMARMELLKASFRLFRQRVRQAELQLHPAGPLSLASALHIIAVYRLCVCVGFQPPAFRKPFIPGAVRKRYLVGLDRLSQYMQAAHIRYVQLQGSGRASLVVSAESDDELRARLLREGLKVVMRGKTA